MTAYVMTGKLTDDHTVTLDEALPIAPTRVRLVVEPLATPALRPYREVLEKIRGRQRNRGYRSPTREEVDAFLSAERDSWGA